MTSPYQNLPAKAFWKSAVAQQPQDLSTLYSERFKITPSTKIATAGSCFAQHITARLKRHGYAVIDEEPPPPGLSEETARRYGYGLYSARYGNIYTVRQLLQLVRETLKDVKPNDVVWRKGTRYYDALRPGVEPDGLDSRPEVLVHRFQHLRHVRQVWMKADVLIFTMGLTEAWVHRDSGTVFPTAPETIAGHFKASVYEFKNFSYEEIIADFKRVRRLLKIVNPNLRFLLTVSPVPLTATASGNHVLTATTYSKAVLRAAAGVLCDLFEDVDYFPSYEIIATPFLGRTFYDANLRSVTKEGVEKVMEVFFAGRSIKPTEVMKSPAVATPNPDSENISAADKRDEAICEDILLGVFNR